VKAAETGISNYHRKKKFVTPVKTGVQGNYLCLNQKQGKIFFHTKARSHEEMQDSSFPL
jgi:hypothetical protein